MRAILVGLLALTLACGEPPELLIETEIEDTRLSITNRSDADYSDCTVMAHTRDDAAFMRDRTIRAGETVHMNHPYVPIAHTVTVSCHVEGEGYGSWSLSALP